MDTADGFPVWWIGTGDDQFGDFHRQTLAWVRGLGLNPDRLAPEAAVVRWNGGYELHVDEIVYSQGRGDRFDPIHPDSLLKARRIVPVEADSWPAMPDRQALVA